MNRLLTSFHISPWVSPSFIPGGFLIPYPQASLKAQGKKSIGLRSFFWF